MRAPTRAELQAALHAIRQAAEQVKSYDQGLVDQLLAAIAGNVETVSQAIDLKGEARARRDRIVAKCHGLQEATARVKQYPEVIMARAVVLDQAGALGRLIRESLPLFMPPS